MNARWLGGALVVSLVVNLVLVGFVAGRASGMHPDFAPPDPVLGFRRVLLVLPEARRDELARHMRSQFREIAPNLKGMRDAQRQLRDALDAPVYHRAAAAEALAAFREHLLASQLASHRAFLDITDALTVEERRLLPGAFEGPHPHGQPGPRRQFERRPDVSGRPGPSDLPPQEPPGRAAAPAPPSQPE